MKFIFLLSVLVYSYTALAQEISFPSLPSSQVYERYGDMPGILQFRGNPSHTFYGMGPVPNNPSIQWRYPESPMKGYSSVGGNQKLWVGTGWTGQPLVWPGMDGQGWEVVFGAYDHDLHFVDWATGTPRAEAFQTNDIIKGTPTIDPDGFPLVYLGSRDNYFRIIAMDQEPRAELWSLNGQTRPGRRWNNDWDGNPTIIDDYLLVGGENSLFYIIKLNRGYDGNGKVRVDPEILVEMPGYNQELFNLIGDGNVSIESSVAVSEHYAYFANSGGRVVGIDLSRLPTMKDPEELIFFDFWVGDDTDASIVIDEEGFLYVAVEKERNRRSTRERQEELGQLVKLDPMAQLQGRDPVMWKNPPINLPSRSGGGSYDAGIWATPALYKEYLYVPTHNGPFYIINKDSGEVVWETNLGWHSWSSPLVVDDQLIVANCTGDILRYDVSNPESPELIWTFTIPSESCIESTPLLWEGRIIVGSRDGYVYSIGD